MERYDYYSNDEITNDNRDQLLINSVIDNANELAEANRLKKIELELKIIEMQGIDPESNSSLSKVDAQVFMTMLKDGSES